MLNVNEYFDKKVCSIAFNNGIRSTVGVMDLGDYTFGTKAEERMVVISGELNVKLPTEQEWKIYKAGEEFIVPANSSYDLKVSVQTAYLCEYKN